MISEVEIAHVLTRRMSQRADKINQELRHGSDPVASVEKLGGRGVLQAMRVDVYTCPLSRLAAADYADGTYFHYTYDAVGNRLDQTVCMGTNCTPVQTAYTYDVANRLTGAGGVSYTWDANGNLLNDGESTYAYDHANHLIQVSGLYTTVLTYNGLGDRVQQSVDGVTTTYSLDLAAGLAQVLGDGTNTYLYGIGRISQQTPNGVQYFLGDALSSVRQLADHAGVATLARNYEPYGEVLNSARSASTPHQRKQISSSDGFAFRDSPLSRKYYNITDH